MRLLKRYFFPSVFAVLSIVGFAILLLSTRWGVGLSPDSAIYIGVARSLLRGFGLSVPSWSGEGAPLVHYPPLYSLLLAGMGLFGMDPLAGARWLNAALFGANVFLPGLCLYTFTRSFYLSASASFLMLISFPMVLVHSMAWSEPLFIFFGFLGIYLLALHVERPNRWVLAASSLAVGLAFLARYAGISLVAAGVGAVLLLAREKWRRRLIQAAIFCSISSVPMVAWITANLMFAGTTTGRKIAYHPPRREQLESFLETISTWLFPVRDPPFAQWLGLLLLAVLSSASLLAMRRGRQYWGQNPSGPVILSLLLGFFVLSYAALLVFSISFLDAQTPLDNRILSPVYVATVLFSLCAVHALSGSPRWREARILPVILGMVLAVVSGTQLMQSASWLERSYDHGVGYASRQWSQAELLKYVKALDREVPIFTNGPDIIYLLAGRPAQMIPRKVDPGTALPNNHYGGELAAMKGQLQEKKGVVVYFYKITWRWYLPPENELREGLDLHVVIRTEDGAVYR